MGSARLPAARCSRRAGATGKALVVHPLVSFLQVAQRDCQRFSHEVAVWKPAKAKARRGALDRVVAASPAAARAAGLASIT
jgi:hypothetical protein